MIAPRLSSATIGVLSGKRFHEDNQINDLLKMMVDTGRKHHRSGARYGSLISASDGEEFTGIDHERRSERRYDIVQLDTGRGGRSAAVDTDRHSSRRLGRGG